MLVIGPAAVVRCWGCYDAFRTVAHLWAAVLHGQQHGRTDIWPGTLETLPAFLGYADCILQMATLLPPTKREGPLGILCSKAWTFAIPPNLVTPVSLESLPLSDEQLQILNEQTSNKRLN